VNPPKGTVQVTKIAAAQRQLDAAIRMFFVREDELATHTVAAAAFQILRDLTKNRGGHFTAKVFRQGILNTAKLYVAGTLPPDKKAIIDGSGLMTIIAPLMADIQEQGDRFDPKRIDVNVSKQEEHKLWLSQTTAFLKHADRDADGSLSPEDLDNEKILMATCSAYLEIMKTPTPEIAAYFAFWAAQNHEIDRLAKEIQPFARQLEAVNEAMRYELCAAHICENKKAI
jgi:hypothetical protein